MSFVLGGTDQDISEFDTHWRAWFDGNIIVYNRATWEMSTPIGIGVPTVFADLLVTAFTTQDYTSWRTPFDPSLIMKSLDEYVGDELNDRAAKWGNALGLRYITEGNKHGVAVEGSFSDAVKKMDQSKYSWYVLTSRQGTLCMRTFYDDFLTKAGKRTLEWRDDAEKGSGYDNHLFLDNFNERFQHFSIEWNFVPFFWNKDPKNIIGISWT